MWMQVSSCPPSLQGPALYAAAKCMLCHSWGALGAAPACWAAEVGSTAPRARPPTKADPGCAQEVNMNEGQRSGLVTSGHGDLEGEWYLFLLLGENQQVRGPVRVHVRQLE